MTQCVLVNQQDFVYFVYFPRYNRRASVIIIVIPLRTSHVSNFSGIRMKSQHEL